MPDTTIPPAGTNLPSGETADNGGTGFIKKLLNNYEKFATTSHQERDDLMAKATTNADNTVTNLALLNNQQTEGRVTGIYVNVASKQDDMMRKAIDAMRG